MDREQAQRAEIARHYDETTRVRPVGPVKRGRRAPSPHAFDLTGRVSGLLKAERPEGYTKRNELTWLCRCDCGRTTVVRSRDLRSGHIRSCGPGCPKRLEFFRAERAAKARKSAPRAA